jgi:hypothetical protein
LMDPGEIKRCTEGRWRVTEAYDWICTLTNIPSLGCLIVH